MNRREHRAVVRAYRSAAMAGVPHREAVGMLTQAAQQAISGGPQAVAQFMQAQGFPQDGAWCGEFAAAVVHSTGGTPPNHPEIASNWRHFGTEVSVPQSGDVAVRRGARTGSTGSHVTFVGGVDPRGRSFERIGGNQGSSNQSPTVVNSRPWSEYQFYRNGAQQGQPTATAEAITRAVGHVPGVPGLLARAVGAGIRGGERVHARHLAQQAAMQDGSTPAQFASNQSDATPQQQQYAGGSGWQQAPATIPHEDIPFAIPPSMPDNLIPEPQNFGQLSAPPTMPDVPDYVPQTYDPEKGIEIGGGLNYGVPQSLDPSYQDAGFSIPTDFSAVPEGSYASQQQQSSMIPITGDINQFASMVDPASQNYDLASYHLPQNQFDILNSFLPDVLLHPNEWEQPSGGDTAPTQAEQSASQNVASNDIQNFGGDMSLGGDLPSSDAAIAGYEGGDPYAQQFYAADAQYGQGGWYYDQYGDIQQNPEASGTDSAWQPQQQVADASQQPQGDAFQNVNLDPSLGSSGAMGGPSYYGASYAGGAYQGGFGGYGGPMQAAGPQFHSSIGGQTQGGLSHGGVDPTSGSSPGPLEGAKGMIAVGEGSRQPGDVLKHGIGTDEFDFTPRNPSQWSESKGWWTPTGTTADSSLAIPMPAQQSGKMNAWGFAHAPVQAVVGSQSPTGLKQGGAIDIAQWMNRKSGKVPGQDHGRDEVNALLRPGEIVVNEGQMRGLKIGNPKLLRADQKRAIKQAKKAA